MKVKVGNKIYDGNKEPVMVILEGQDKENIKNMLPEATKYCMFPDDIPKEEIEEWMEIEDGTVIEFDTKNFEEEYNKI